MQNHEKPGNEKWVRLPGWVRENWKIISVILLLIVVIYLTTPIQCRFPIVWKPPKPPTLLYNPVTGAVITDSDTAKGVIGNGDGQLNPGEQVRVRLYMTNIGNKPSEFDLVLSTHETAVRLIDNIVHFKKIEKDSTALSEDPFVFSLASNYVAGCVVFIGKIQNVVNAGLVGESGIVNTDGEMTIPINVLTNFRVCLISCVLKEGPSMGAGTFKPDTLKIDLRLCNASDAVLGNASARASIKIDAVTVAKCDTPRAPFSAILETVGTTNVRMDSLVYATPLPKGHCIKPDDPTGQAATGQFRFETQLPPLPNVNNACISFHVIIYEGTTQVGRAYMGVEAIVMH